MSGIRETRKKMQRGVIHMVECEKADAVLHELMLLKQTVDSQVSLLSERMNRKEEHDDAFDTEEIHHENRSADEDSGDPVSQAAQRGYDTLFGQ